MRRLAALLILAVVSVAALGCRTDPGSQHSSGMQARASGSASPSLPASDSSSAAAGESPVPDAPARAGADPNDHRPIIVCFGDSLTAGYGADPGQAYPDYLQQELDRRHIAYRVVNEGVSGNTTKDGLERLGQVIALHPRLAVVEFGGNDGLRGVAIRESRANLDTIVAHLQSAGIRVALAGITLPPDYGPDYIRQFDETYTLLARKYRVPMIPFLLEGVYGTPGMMQADRTHATAAGNRVVASNVMGLISPLLAR